MQKNTFKYLYSLLALTLLLLIGLGAVAFRNLHGLLAYSDLVEHTNAVLFRNEEVISTMKDAELGARGYLLTHDSKFLEPYYHSFTSVNPLLEALDSLTRDNPAQTQRIDTLKYLITQRFQTMNRSISLSVRAANRDSLRQMLLRGKTLMDRTRQIVNDIKKEEEELLIERESQKLKYSALTPIWLGVISGLAALLFSLSFIRLIVELRKRHQYAARLEESVINLKQSNDELERFAYVAAHHLQEPLRKLLTFCNRLKNKYSDNMGEEVSLVLQRVEVAAYDMKLLVQDLWRFSQFGKPFSQDDCQLLPLRTALDQALSAQAVALSNTQAQVQVEGEWPTVCGNLPQLRELFSHLLENSLKFVKKNEVPLVWIKASRVAGREIEGVRQNDLKKQFCKILFKDQGIGFDEIYTEKIFQLFQRLHHKHEFSGTGIGLSICKKVIMNHNGYLAVQSQPEQGTTFIICLPLAS